MEAGVFECYDIRKQIALKFNKNVRFQSRVGGRFLANLRSFYKSSNQVNLTFSI